MHMWTGKEWSQVQGMFLDLKSNTSIVKDFVYCSVDSEKQIPDFTVIKDPKWWVYPANANKEWKRLESSNKQNYIILKQSMNDTSRISFISLTANKKNVQYTKANGTIQKKGKNECRGREQFVSAKILQKCLHRVKPVYLALV